MKKVMRTIVAVSVVVLMLAMQLSAFAAAPTYATKTVYNADGTVTVTLSNFGGVDAGESLAISGLSEDGYVWVDQVKAEDLGASYSFTMSAAQASATSRLEVRVGDDNEGASKVETVIGTNTVTVTTDGNGYVQLADSASANPAGSDSVSTAKTHVSFYVFPKAGYELATVAGEEDVVVSKGNLVTVPVLANNTTIAVTFKKIAATSPVVVEGSGADKALKLSHGYGGTRTWSEVRISKAGIAGAVDEYTLDFRFKLPTLTYGAVGNRAFAVRNANNDLQFIKNGSNLDFYLGNNTVGSGNADVLNGSYYLGSAPMSQWQDVTLHVYKSGSKTLTDVTLNGVTIEGLEKNFAEVTEPTIADRYFSMSNIYGEGSTSNYCATYDFYLDHLNLTYEGSSADLCDEFDTATVSGSAVTLKGGKTYEGLSTGAYTPSLVDGTGVSTANGFASGHANTIKSANPAATYDGIEVLSRIGYGTADKFGIIMGVKPLTGELTLEDLENYDATNAADKDTIYTVFRGFAAGADGRFGVQVVDSAASNNYFSGGLKVYVYVFAANSETGEVVYKAVNADGFTFN